MPMTRLSWRHSRVYVSVLLGLSVTMVGCALLESDPVEFTDLTADVQVTPAVLALSDTARVHITVNNPTARWAILDVSCGPGYQVFSNGESMLGWGCPQSTLDGLRIPPRGSLVIDDLLAPVHYGSRRTYTVLPPGEYRLVAGWHTGPEFHAIGEGVVVRVLDPTN